MSSNNVLIISTVSKVSFTNRNDSMNIKGNKLFTTFYIFFLGTLFFSSCSLSNLNDPDQVFDLKKEIEVNLFQDLHNPNNYKWLISTIEDNFCKESSLITSYQQNTLRDQLYIQGLEIPNNCSSYNSRITSHEAFILEEGKREIEIYLTNDEVSSTILEKVDNVVLIQNDNRQIISIPQNNLLPISKNHLWGGLLSNLEQDKALFYGLFEDICENLLYTNVVKGNHGYFITDENSMRAFDPETFEFSNISFAVRIEETFEINKSEIAAKVMSFRMSHPTVEIFLSLGDGTQF